MTVPRFLDSTFCDSRYTQLAGVTDVNTILAALTTQLVTNPAVGYKWTEAPAGTFTSPADDEGRTIVCAFSRIAATNLQMILSCGGITVCTRRIQVDGGGTNVDIFSGKFYVIVDSQRATPEFMIAALFEMTPVPTLAYPYPAIGTAYRSNGDAADGSGAYGYFFLLDSTGTPAGASRLRCPAYNMAAAAIGLQMPSGRLIFYDPTVALATYGWLGRPCQMLVGYHSAVGTEKNAPIDTDGTTALFRATSWGGATTGRLWVRKS